MPGRRAKGGGRGRRRQGLMGFLRSCLLFLLTRDDAHGHSLLDELAISDQGSSRHYRSFNRLALCT